MKILVNDKGHSFVKKCSKYQIKLKFIITIKNGYIIYLSISNYQKIVSYLPYYDINILRIYNFSTLFKIIYQHAYQIVLYLIFIISYYIISHFIINIEVLTNNYKLSNNLTSSLKDYGLKPYTFVKDYHELNDIKKNILKDYNNEIEWLEIRSDGMKYYIDVVEKVNKKPQNIPPYCHIYAKKEGIVEKVIYERGVSVVKKHDYVKKGDLLISGDITYNDTIFNQTCATGKVYAKVWYEVNISLPIKREVTETSNKYRYNIMIDNNNILKSRVHNPIIKDKHQINIFNHNISLNKEYESSKKTVTYNEDELIKEAYQLIKDKFNVKLRLNEKIIEQKVLKKTINDSTIDIVMFVETIEDISFKKEIAKE